MKRFWWSLNPLGVVVGAILLALSLTPSLPRPAVLQGFGSGLVFGIGNAIGVGMSAALARWAGWRPSAGTLRTRRRVGWPVFAVAMAGAAVAGVAARTRCGAWSNSRPSTASTSSASWERCC